MVEFLNRYVALGKETTYGAEVDATTFGEVDDESFATRMDLLTRQDMSRPVVGKSVTGKEYSEGGYNMAVQLDEFLGNTLAAFFPKATYASTIHTFKEPTVAADEYNSYTIEVGREEQVHTYTGMVANTLSLTASVGEYVMMSADFVGCREKATQSAISDTAITFEGDALDALYFSNGTVFFDDGTVDDPVNSATSASVKSIDFQISLNPDTDNAMALGDSTYSSKPKMQRREVTGTVEFNKVLYGAQTTDEPDYTSLITTKGLAYNDGTDPVMILHFTEEDTPADNYIKFNFYNIRWEAPTSNVSGRDSQTMSVGFVALYDNNLGCMDITAKGGALGTTAF